MAPTRVSPLGWTAPNGSSARITAEAAKVAPFTSRMSSGPPSSNATAASAGPAVKPRSAIAPYREVAAGTSSSSTRLGRPASAAGVNRAVPVPASAARASVAPKESTSATPMKATARIMSAATTQVRRDQRSATAPKNGPSSIAGSRSASSTRLIAQGESRRSKATSSSATYAAPVPSDDCASARKNQRAARLRRSRRATSLTARVSRSP